MDLLVDGPPWHLDMKAAPEQLVWGTLSGQREVGTLLVSDPKTQKTQKLNFSCKSHGLTFTLLLPLLFAFKLKVSFEMPNAYCQMYIFETEKCKQVIDLSKKNLTKSNIQVEMLPLQGRILQ